MSHARSSPRRAVRKKRPRPAARIDCIFAQTKRLREQVLKSRPVEEEVSGTGSVASGGQDKPVLRLGSLTWMQEDTAPKSTKNSSARRSPDKVVAPHSELAKPDGLEGCSRVSNDNPKGQKETKRRGSTNDGIPGPNLHYPSCPSDQQSPVKTHAERIQSIRSGVAAIIRKHPQYRNIRRKAQQVYSTPLSRITNRRQKNSFPQALSLPSGSCNRYPQQPWEDLFRPVRPERLINPESDPTMKEILRIFQS